MSDLELKPVIPLETRRCYDCGRWYAFEQGWAHCCNCPYCANRDVARARAERAELERSNRSLRGALTRRRRRG
jgi:hypothetical protein